MKQIIHFAIVFTLLAGHSFAQENNHQKDADSPTPIQIGVMTKKQRLNSKRYNRSLEVPTLISEDRDILRGIGESMITEDLPVPPAMEIYFQKPICRTQAIIAGKVKDKSSQLSEDSKSIFTDYEVEVTNIIKNDSASNFKTGERITVTRSGGIVELNSRRIEVADVSYERLKIDKEYLLFLNYLSDSDSFEPGGTLEGTFEIKGNKIKRLESRRAPYIINDDFTFFPGMVKTAAKQCAR